MRFTRLAVLLVCLSAVTGCAITPPIADAAHMCRFKTIKVETEAPPVVPTNPRWFEAKVPDRLLILSGGGEDGAFGAGLLAQWHELNAGKLPEFKEVTGISTGAMLSTFAFIDEPDVLTADYAISRESDLLRAYARKNGKGDITFGSYPKIVKKGAVSDLEPLRKKLQADISYAVLAKVAAKARYQRLLVGALDVDSGDAIAFDMTDMASRATLHPEASPQFTFYRDCYIQAVIASSSQPPAAPPAFIDNREYVDGGARFGVFLDRLGNLAGLSSAQSDAALTDSARATLAKTGAGEKSDSKLPTPPILFVIVNGTQVIEPSCGKLDKKQCPDGVDPSDNLLGAHATWSILPLAMRTSKSMINQIYRFSVADLYARYDKLYGDADHHIYYMPIVPGELAKFPAGSDETCPILKKRDDDELRVLEFHPRYMACLIAYGRRFAADRSIMLRGASMDHFANIDRAIRDQVKP